MTGTRTGDVMTAIRSRIASRALAPDEKLPSIRSFAKRMNVSPSTVVDAYDRLAAEGIIRSQRGSGFYVCSPLAPLDLATIGPKLDREIDPFWVSRQSLDAETDMLKPGCGWLPPDWMPNDGIRKAIRKLARASDALLSEYGSTRGSKKLRHFLGRQLADEGINARPEQIMLSISGTQAIDLICRFLLRPGDSVIVDDPCYFNFQALLKAHEVNVVSVPYTASGPNMQRFAEALTAHKPRLYITNSALHNPTGATMSPQTAHQLLTLAAKHDLTIVEDDIFSAFEPSSSPRLASLDGLERVIRIGSFSKPLSASIRCGYIAARADWIEALIDLQVATNFGGPSPLTSEMLFHILSDGSYRKHMEDVRQKLSKKRLSVAKELSALGIVPWLMPRGGFYLWCTLPEGLDSAHIAREALKHNLVLAPGNVFSPSQTMAHYMRFNVSQMSDPKTLTVLKNVIASSRN
ncbi:PLP-dependent aminotransferase family protein [Ahrensia kielensis]|uniref:PLP-dependent aminotransferase family protein n=1 Tax=Ahrensia kielensis TaxID=76980 RepID=A0ABU9T6E7_9HYPH